MRNIITRRVLCALFALTGCVLVPAGLHALGAGEKTKNEPIKEYTLTISGTVRLVGNEPFLRLLISSAGGKDYIVDEQSPARKALLSRQGKRVVMEGLVREYPVYAGKKYLGIEYVISPRHYDAEPDKP